MNEKYYPHLWNSDRYFINVGSAGSGKCLGRGTNVVMGDGSLKAVEDIKVGDSVLGIDSKPKTVIHTNTGYGKLFLVKQNKGMDYVVNKYHQLAIAKGAAAKNTRGTQSRKRPNGKFVNYDDYITMETQDYIKQSKNFKRYFYGYRKAVDFPERELKIDPYFLGLWLGDGTNNCTTITNSDPEIIKYIHRFAKNNKYFVKYWKNKKNTNTISVNTGHTEHLLHDIFNEYNLFKEKHIPDDYLYNSREVRLQLLAGILDTDGYLGGNCYEIVQKRHTLAKQIKYLANSLGLRCSIKKCKKGIKSIGFVGDYYRMNISGNTHEIPVKVERRKIKSYSKNVNPLHTGITVEEHGEGDYFGFELEGDGYFFLEDFTVTHNSWSIAQKLCYRFFKQDVGHRFLILRRYSPDLELSAFKLVKDTLIEWGLFEYCHVTVKPMYIRNNLNGNEMYFRGMDDLAKIKSIENVTSIWYEEATEARYDDILQLDLRLRPKFKLSAFQKQQLMDGVSNARIGNYAQFMQSYNPISKDNWTYKEHHNPKKPSYRKKIVTEVEYLGKKHKIEGMKTVLHSTYKDNRFLPMQYVAMLEDLINKDEAYYKIYCLGEYADLKNKIFNNYTIIHEIPDLEWDKVYCGLDFGFVHPMALVKVYQKDDENGQPKSIYCETLFHQSKYTTSELITWMDDNKFDKRMMIWCDNAEPDRIEELCKAGYNARACYKGGKNFVIDSIDFMKMLNINLLERDVKLKQEFYSYRYKEDKNGIVKEEPIDINDDGIKAVIYATYTEYIQGNKVPKVRWIKTPFV